MRYILLLVLCTQISSIWAKEKKSVFVKKLNKTAVFNTYSYPAKVESKVSSKLRSQIEGTLVDLKVSLGQSVKKGQVLAKIKHNDPIYQYKSLSLRSQVSGVVSKVFKRAGAQLAKGEEILLVTNPKDIKINIEVPAADLAYLKLGLKAEFEINQKTYPVIIKGLSPYVDPALGSASAELELVDRKQKLNIGILGKVSFKSNLHQAIIIPDSAILYRGKKSFARLVDDKNIVSKVEIKLGPKRKGMVEVLDGLEVGQTLVERASGYLPEGSEVKIETSKK